MIKFKNGEGDLIKNGGLEILLAKLEDADTALMRNLKNERKFEDMRYYQGASSVIDSLIKILK